MHRLFTFGCSFTQYWRWPTWADMLGRHYDYFENWGICGGGNAQILYNLIECNQRHSIQPGDSVYIMWTNVSREDRYVKDRWLEGGNVYWGSELGENYVKRYACERGYTIRDFAVISAVGQLLRSWGCEWRMFSMVPLARSNSDNQLGENPTGETQIDDVYDLYKNIFDDIAPSVLDTVFGGDWFTGTGIPDSFDPSRRDFHPTPLEHITYLDRVWSDNPLNESTRSWAIQCQDLLLQKQPLPWTPAIPNRL